VQFLILNSGCTQKKRAKSNAIFLKSLWEQNAVKAHGGGQEAAETMPSVPHDSVNM
jgi:hypothetical protein